MNLYPNDSILQKSALLLSCVDHALSVCTRRRVRFGDSYGFWYPICSYDAEEKSSEQMGCDNRDIVVNTAIGKMPHGFYHFYSATLPGKALLARTKLSMCAVRDSTSFPQTMLNL